MGIHQLYPIDSGEFWKYICSRRPIRWDHFRTLVVSVGRAMTGTTHLNDQVHWQPLFEPHLCILSIFLFPSKCFLRFFHDLTGPSHYVPRLPSQRPGKQCPLDSWAATGRWDIPLCNRWTIIIYNYDLLYRKCRDYKVIIDDYWWLSSHFRCYCYWFFWRDIYDCIYHLTGFYHHIGLYGILL